jgi:hypothetical protein
MEILIPALTSAPVKAALVNWLPWSVLKISGTPCVDQRLALLARLCACVEHGLMQLVGVELLSVGLQDGVDTPQLLRIIRPNNPDGFPTLASIAIHTANDAAFYSIDDVAKAAVRHHGDLRIHKSYQLCAPEDQPPNELMFPPVSRSPKSPPSWGLIPALYDFPCTITLTDNLDKKYQFKILEAGIPPNPIWSPHASGVFAPNVVSCPDVQGFVKPKDWCVHLTK